MPGELNSANTTPRSTGPRTPALNARASLNALNHGRTSGNHPALLTIDRNRLIQTLRSTRLPAPTPANREQRERVFFPTGPRTPAGDAKKCVDNLLFRPTQPIHYIDAYTQIGTPNELHSNPGETLVKPWSNPGQTPGEHTPFACTTPAPAPFHPLPGNNFFIRPKEPLSSAHPIETAATYLPLEPLETNSEQTSRPPTLSDEPPASAGGISCVPPALAGGSQRR
jgi:hypothetical protein